MIKKKSKSEKLQEKDAASKTPEGVMVISVLMFASSFLFFLIALSMFNAANPSNQELMLINGISQNQINPANFLYLGILLTISGVISYLVGRGLIKLQKRAWIAFIIIIMASLIMSISALIQYKQYYSSLYLIALQLIALVYMMQKKIIREFGN